MNITYKIGDNIKIIKPNHKCYGISGKILKIKEDDIYVYVDDCKRHTFSINKKYKN